MAFCLEEAIGYLGWYALAISGLFTYFMGYRTFLDILILYPSAVRLTAKAVTSFILVSCGAVFVEHFNAPHFFLFVVLYAFYLKAMGFPEIVKRHVRVTIAGVLIASLVLIILWIQHLRQRPVSSLQALGFLLTAQGVAPVMLTAVAFVDKGMLSTFMRPWQAKSS